MIWLVGNRGMLGGEVHRRLRARNLRHAATDLEVDIADGRALEAFTDRLDLSWIVNCSAYTAVDRAEDEPDQAFRINAEGVRNLTLAARGKRARLLHISTDYVFDGMKEGPYMEEDVPNPLGVYGRSKLQGEFHIREIWGSHVILRTAWLYGPGGNNFVRTMLRLFGAREEVRVVADQWGNPTLAGDLADAIIEIITRETVPYGTYHFTNEGRTNWFEFAREIHDQAMRKGLLEKAVRIAPIQTEQYPTRARRPANSCLSKEKIREAYGISVRPWREALADCIGQIEKETGSA